MDIDETVMLDVHEDMQKPWKAQLHQEDGQCDENANGDVPDAHGVLAKATGSMYEQHSQCPK